MISSTDAAILAITKLRTRRIRLWVTVIISSLLLAVLVFGLIFTGGVFKSIEDFQQQGLNNRYLVAVSVTESWDGIDENKAVIARATQLHDEQIALRKAEAKKLGLEYSQKSEDGVFMPPVYEGGPEYLNYGNPSVTKAIGEYFASVPYNKSTLNQLKLRYNATTVYPLDVYFGGYSVREMKDGVEKFGDYGSPEVGNPAKWPITIYGLSEKLTKPFIFDTETLTKNKPEGESVPVIVPYSYAETLAGFEKLPASASSQEKLERIKQVRERAPKQHPLGCYRNHASEGLVQLALDDIKQMAKNKNNKEYMPPSVTRALPDESSCGAVTVKDKRTKAEKDAEQKQKQLAAIGLQSLDSEEPKQYKIPFQIVGIAPDAPNPAEGLSLPSLMSAVAGSNLDNNWVIPAHLQSQAGGLTTNQPIAEMAGVNIFEFTSPGAAQKFINTMKCPLSSCEMPKRVFTVRQMGSNSIIINELRSTASQALLLVGLVVVVLAALIMMGNLGRMITDSRRETAVFRAIGAKRIDITIIYLIYIALIALMIACVSYSIGLGAAMYVNAIYSKEATAQALLNFGTADMAKTFQLINIVPSDALIILGLAILAAVIGSIIPLLRNVRRNPIRDMRDE